jgi:hypothetical protein
VNLTDRAKALLDELERVRNANPSEARETRYSVLKNQIERVVTGCAQYLDQVRRIRDEQTPKCPACGHAWGYHPETGQYQDYLGCSYGAPQTRYCGCKESPPKE